MDETRETCSHKGCTNLARRRGLCDSHAKPQKPTCSHGGCTNVLHSRGLCKGCIARGVEPAPDRRLRENRDSAPELLPVEQVARDREKLQASGALTSLRTKYREALSIIERQEGELRAMNVLSANVEVFPIQPQFGQGVSEATPVLVASDWHVEETVGAEVGGLNRYNLDIAAHRASEFFERAVRLTRLINKDVKIDTVVLALLGDFITGNIHGEENAEKNELSPNHAIVFAQNQIISGIEYLLNNTKFKFVIPCHSGNHARTTHTTRFGNENGHSLEYLMYLHLAAYFRSEPRITFIIPEGYHSYVDVYDTTLRFHHGHAVKYGGGIGGLFIPTYKAISQWQKGRNADLDVFGHFHQMKDGGNFLCNGSLIGYNAYALAIKSDYEPPRQTMFILDKRRGRTFTMPILFSR